jgi:hypothetical protein
MLVFRGKSKTRALPIPPPWPYDSEAVKAVEETVMYTNVERSVGGGHDPACVIRFLNITDVDAAEELNLGVLCRLPHPHVLRREGRDYLAHHIKERGRCIGAFLGNQMIAFTVLSFPRDEPDNLGIDLGFPRDQRLHVCHFELSGVHPDFRGNRLHRTMNLLRARLAGSAGYNHLCGTVSPRNPYSMRNHMAGGMMVRKLVQKYGGMDRYVIYRDYNHEATLLPDADEVQVTCPCLDITSQKDLLASGFWGIAVNKVEDGTWHMTFVPRTKVVTP